ncbi:MAG: IS91 family transposase [Magnetospirillum sp.]|nr:MAG: IS91 family transposase [Magnetospirillum sp.]
MAGGLDVAEVFRRYGETWRAAQEGGLDRGRRRVMAAIEACRTARLGGHSEACDDCGLVRIAYNSCRNRHCPKCQGLARAQWLADRQAELLPVPYFHVVFTLPTEIAAIAFHNKAVVYDILFKAANETLRTIAADPRHLGAELGVVAVLHTWGQALQHHPHLHCIVPAGGLSPKPAPAAGGSRWVACRPGFFLPVKVLSRLFRRRFLDLLLEAYRAGRLSFFSDIADLADPAAFARHLAPLRRAEWVVYAKPPFGGPEQVLAYLGRYTHRVAIANSRLVTIEDGRVHFRWKDYRHHDTQKIMGLEAGEFIRRFLLHVLPDGFHRIRHYGFLANGHRAARLETCRRLLAVPPLPTAQPEEPDDYRSHLFRLTGHDLRRCPCCGGTMAPFALIPRRVASGIRIDTS